jgi:hypothetical protein
MKRALKISAGVAVCVGALAGLGFSSNGLPPLDRRPVEAALEERVAEWERYGLSQVPELAQDLGGEGSAEVELTAGACWVVLAARWGAIEWWDPNGDPVALEETRACPHEPFSVRARLTASGLSRGDWLVSLAQPGAGMAVRVLRAPYSDHLDPTRFPGKNDEGQTSQAARAYVRSRSATYLETFGAVLLAPAEVPSDRHAALIPDVHTTRGALFQARGIYPGVERVPAGEAVPVEASVLSEERLAALSAAPERVPLAESRRAIVRDRERAVRALGVVDPTVFLAECVDVHWIPLYREAAEARALHVQSGEEETLVLGADGAFRHRLCASEGVTLYTEPAATGELWWVAITDASGASVDESRSPSAEAAEADPRVAACVADPHLDECPEVIAGLAHGANQALAPTLARQLAEARCDREQPASCTLWVEAVMATGELAAITDALEVLGSACDAGDGPACALRAEAHRTGFGVGEDRNQAKADYELACAAEVTRACATFESMQLEDAER